MHSQDDCFHPEYFEHQEEALCEDLEEPQGQVEQPPGQFPEHINQIHHHILLMLFHPPGYLHAQRIHTQWNSTLTSASGRTHSGVIKAPSRDHKKRRKQKQRKHSTEQFLNQSNYLIKNCDQASFKFQVQERSTPAICNVSPSFSTSHQVQHTK
jgi:hypothetical protein